MNWQRNLLTFALYDAAVVQAARVWRPDPASDTHGPDPTSDTHGALNLPLTPMVLRDLGESSCVRVGYTKRSLSV